MDNRWAHLSANERKALEAIFWQHGPSRDVLARELELSRTHANAVVAGLLAQRWVGRRGMRESSGGRRAETLCLHPSLGVLLCADLSAARLEVAVLGLDLQVRARRGEPVEPGAGPAVALARMRALMRETLAQCGLAAADVLAVGLGVPGTVDFPTGRLDGASLMPGWDGFPVREDLRAEFDAPVWIDNDANLMALAEFWRRSRTLRDFLVVKADFGVRCGVVCNGGLHRGANGRAGDVGHLCVDPHGPRGHCGEVGCGEVGCVEVEVVAGGPAVMRAALEAARSGRSPWLARRLAEAGRLALEDVGAASRAGDDAADRIAQEAGSAIGRMLAAVVDFFDPSHVFVGGGLAAIGPPFLEPLRQGIHRGSPAPSARRLELACTPPGDSDGLVGAGVLAMQEMLRGQGRPRP